MSERYFRIGPRIWADSADWSEDARSLAFYLLTCPHRTTEGLFRLPKSYILGDLEWLTERLTEPFEELISKEFIAYDEDRSVVLICKALKWQAPANPNGVTAAIRAIEELPETHLLSDFYAAAQRYCERLAEGLLQRFPERLGESPSPSPSPTSEQPARELAAVPPELAPILQRLDQVNFSRSLPDLKVPAAVKACKDFSDRDLTTEVDKFAHYWIDGAGENRTLKDVAGAWRNWLRQAPSASASKRRSKKSPRSSLDADLKKLKDEHDQAIAEEAA